MKIHKEGKKIVRIAAFVTIALAAVIVWLLPLHHWALQVSLLFLFLLFFWILWFFRTPSRNINKQDDAFLSPADGRVVIAEETRKEDNSWKTVKQVSIFMSPLNVHLNRYPADGKIISYTYYPGKYMVAWHPKSSQLNERNAIVMETPGGKQIVLSQVAGTVARRIVCYSEEGKHVKQGEEMGFIKFGSRVDVILPVDVELLVKPGDKVRAGLDVLARSRQQTTA